MFKAKHTTPFLLLAYFLNLISSADGGGSPDY
jgi:hypothetical protein